MYSTSKLSSSPLKCLSYLYSSLPLQYDSLSFLCYSLSVLVVILPVSCLVPYPDSAFLAVVPCQSCLFLPVSYLVPCPASTDSAFLAVVPYQSCLLLSVPCPTLNWFSVRHLRNCSIVSISCLSCLVPCPSPAVSTSFVPYSSKISVSNFYLNCSTYFCRWGLEFTYKSVPNSTV